MKTCFLVLVLAGTAHAQQWVGAPVRYQQVWPSGRWVTVIDANRVRTRASVNWNGGRPAPVLPRGSRKAYNTQAIGKMRYQERYGRLLRNRMRRQAVAIPDPNAGIDFRLGIR